MLDVDLNVEEVAFANSGEVAMRIRQILLCCLLSICCGCSPSLIDNREVTMKAGEIVPIVFGPFGQEKTVKVIVSSPGAPISVYVHPQDKTEHVDYAISFDKEPQDTYAGVASTEGETLTAVIPANTEAVVRLQPVGQSEPTVQLKISN